MDVQYKNKKVQKQCTDLSCAKKCFPKEVAERLMANINFIENAKNLSDIEVHKPFRFHRLSGKRKDEFAVDIGKKLGYRLIIIPLDENNKQIKNNNIEIIKQCTKILLVVEVTNHYE